MFLSKISKVRRVLSALGTVSINFRPMNKSYGGMNVFVQQITTWLERRGYRVVYDLRPEVDVIFIVHPWMTHTDPYGFKQVKAFMKQTRNVRLLLRINECDQRKSTNHMDQWLAEWEAIATHTYFISHWLRDYHAERWFDTSHPHTAIYNGADPTVFHPIGSKDYELGGPLRIVTHHWSDNRMKGYGDYEKLDSMISSGEINDVEFLVIGRWPADIKWRAATTHGAVHGVQLANMLRGCHVYLTGSYWEPGGMHQVEGVQCGLPVIYHSQGGGIVEYAKEYGIEYSDDLVLAIETMRQNYVNYRAKVFHSPPASGDDMCLRTIDLIQKLRVN